MEVDLVGLDEDFGGVELQGWSAYVRRTQAPKKAGCFSEASPLQIIFTSNPCEPVELVTGLFH